MIWDVALTADVPAGSILDGQFDTTSQEGQVMGMPIDDLHPSLDLAQAEPGVTRVLTEEGWEEALYVDPSDDWSLLADGSWSSPDGRTRSWPLVGPEPAEPY